MKIKSQKNENEAFAEFKYLENNQLYSITLRTSVKTTHGIRTTGVVTMATN